MTLNCRAFRVNLANHAANTIRIGEPACDKPWISIEVKNPKWQTWIETSHTKVNPTCASKVVLKSLKPGETFDYVLRFQDSGMEPGGNGLEPGYYSVRAVWAFFDCEEEEGNDNCLPPQQWLRITSNELNVRSPEIENLGELKLGFEVKTASVSKEELASLTAFAESRGPSSDVERLPFHYFIRNLGADPIKNAHLDCGDSWITPEYQLNGGDWKPLPYKPSRYDFCTLNVEKIQTILPGKAAEGNFTLSTLSIRYDTSDLESSGGQLRFVLMPNTCVASVDGSFCLTGWARGKPILSNALTITPIKATTIKPAPLP